LTTRKRLQVRAELRPWLSETVKDERARILLSRWVTGEDGVVADVQVTETLAWSTGRRRGLQLQHELELVAMGRTGGKSRRRKTEHGVEHAPCELDIRERRRWA
jgi:hypothetical protein